jgi:cullin 3
MVNLIRASRQRKQLSHTQLIGEVIQQLASRFSPVVPFIKQRIENLIEREYLDRADDANSSMPTYVYLA